MSVINWADLDEWPVWRTYPEFCDGLPNDPAADAGEALQERYAREDAVAAAVMDGTVTRAMVEAFPFVVLRMLRVRDARPTLTWVRCGAFRARLVAGDESLPGGRTLAGALCEYIFA